jgi:hypothetical protein
MSYNKPRLRQEHKTIPTSTALLRAITDPRHVRTALNVPNVVTDVELATNSSLAELGAKSNAISAREDSLPAVSQQG